MNTKTLFRIHGWLGLNLGILLYVICLSGSIAVFGPELDWLIQSERRVDPPTPEAQPLSWGDLYNRVKEAHPHAIVTGFQAAPGKRSAVTAQVAYPPRDTRQVFINPFSGEVQGQSSTFGVKSFFRIFHKQFYIVPAGMGFHGTLLVGAFGVVLLFSVVTGLLFYRGWWKSLFKLRRDGNWRIFWSDLHRLLGVWSLLVALVIALTGIWYLVERTGWMRGIVAAAEPSSVRMAAPVDRGSILQVLPLDDLVAKAQAALPELKIDFIRLPARVGETFWVWGQSGAWIARSRANQVVLDPYSGEVLSVREAKKLPLAARLIESADPLHFGTFGGFATRLIWFVAGLALSVGILAGATIHYLRTARDDQAGTARRRWEVRLSEIVTIGVLVMGAISAVEFIDNQISGGTNGSVRPLAQFDFVDQPARLQVYDSPSSDRQMIGIVLPEGSHPNITGAILVNQSSTNAIRLRLMGNMMIGSVARGELWEGPLELGARFAGGQRERVSISAVDSQAAGGLLPAPPAVPLLVYILIGCFGALMLLPLLCWPRRFL